MERNSVNSLLRCAQAYCNQLCDKHTLDYGIVYYCERFPEVPELNQFREVVIERDADIEAAFAQASQWFAKSGLACYRWAPAQGAGPAALSDLLTARGYTSWTGRAFRLTRWVELEPAQNVRVLPARAMRRAYRETLDAAPPKTGSIWSPRVAEACEERLDDPSFDMFVALVDKQPAGRCALYQVGDLAQVRDVSVTPEFADRGVERALLSHVLALAKRLTMRNVLATVATDDERRSAWFADAGFVEDGAIEEFRRDPIDARKPSA